MVRKEYIVDEIVKILKDTTQVRNVAIIAHVHHGKTTLTDSLLARAGLISKAAAGEALYTNYEAIEKDRKMTIKSADISLGFPYNGKDYIINLIDTPGHVDFGGGVTKAMRAVDGVILVVDPVEGIMPQTETVLKQALKEKAKPILFINKVDRLLTELRLTPEDTFARISKLITDINTLIDKNVPEEFKGKWNVSVEDGTVAMGSAVKKWAISKLIMEKYHTTFKDIFKLTAEGDEAKLQEVGPIDEAILAMIVDHLPNPDEAQPYRIPNTWEGDINSEAGKAMVSADEKAPVTGVVFNITYDQHSGEVVVARIFSGVVKKGTELHISGQADTQRVQMVGIYMGPERVIVDEIPAGNIAAIVGLKDVSIGDTISEKEMEPFEQITHYSKPVVTKAIEAKDSRDTSKLIEALRELSKEDTTVVVEINPDTGEHLVSGMGELHLETIETKLKDNFKIPIIASPPIVIYRETISGNAGPIESKTPNRHTRFYMTVEPLPEGVQKAMDEGIIREGPPKGQTAIEDLVKAGLDRNIAKNTVDIYNKCLLADVTHGVQYMNEVMELLIKGFREAIKDGPLAREKCSGVQVNIVDAKIHEDPVHRGPAQVIPAARNGVYAGMLTAGVYLLEPMQIYTVESPQDYLSGLVTFLQSKRGQVESITQEGEDVRIVAKLPVADTLKGFSNDMRGLTQGRATWYTEFAGFEKLSANIQAQVVRSIRERKGQPPEPPKASDFLV